MNRLVILIVVLLAGLVAFVFWPTKQESRQYSTKNPIVVVETSMGNIDIELFPDKAPKTVENFLKYVNKGFYKDTLFHRVIPNFMIQGGGFIKGMVLKPTDDPIENESSNGLSNRRGTVAMARASGPKSATSQFFINVKDNDKLDRDNAPDQFGYCVFGQVIAGMDVVDRIRNVRTATMNMGENRNYQDVPVQDVLIKSIRRVN